VSDTKQREQNSSLLSLGVAGAAAIISLAIACTWLYPSYAHLLDSSVSAAEMRELREQNALLRAHLARLAHHHETLLGHQAKGSAADTNSTGSITMRRLLSETTALLSEAEIAAAFSDDSPEEALENIAAHLEDGNSEALLEPGAVPHGDVAAPSGEVTPSIQGTGTPQAAPANPTTWPSPQVESTRRGPLGASRPTAEPRQQHQQSEDRHEGPARQAAAVMSNMAHGLLLLSGNAYRHFFGEGSANHVKRMNRKQRLGGTPLAWQAHRAKEGKKARRTAAKSRAARRHYKKRL